MLRGRMATRLRYQNAPPIHTEEGTDEESASQCFCRPCLSDVCYSTLVDAPSHRQPSTSRNSPDSRISVIRLGEDYRRCQGFLHSCCCSRPGFLRTTVRPGSS